jgi:hypothetical protein
MKQQTSGPSRRALIASGVVTADLALIAPALGASRSTEPRKGFNERIGDCRDFAHLALTFCWCLNIPPVTSMAIPASPAFPSATLDNLRLENKDGTRQITNQPPAPRNQRKRRRRSRRTGKHRFFQKHRDNPEANKGYSMRKRDLKGLPG